jgi:hypothetical protein
MAKVFKIMVPDNSLISRTLYIESLSTELYVIDRADKKFVAEHSEDLSKPALYILANRDERKLYIGKTDDSLKRLRNHEAKDFWTEAIVFHSNPDTNTLSTTEVEWLEAKTYETIKELGYYDLSENRIKPKAPTLKRDQQINCPEYLETAKNYICAAGFDFFLKKKEDKKPIIQQDLFNVTPTKPIKSESQNIWLICYDSKYFNVVDCFKKYGQIYWRHKAGVQNVQKGDIAYLYSSRPESAIRFKVEVIESHLPYSTAMDAEDEFLVSGQTIKEPEKEKYFIVRPIAETHSKALNFSTLQKKKLVGGRVTTTILSKKAYQPLREYIEQHFEENVNNNLGRRPPFKFSMIGLKPGDMVYFEHGDIPVTIVSENTIDYDNEIYTLSRFCKHFMPDEDSENKEYQGPAHFLYNGRTLDDIRKEKEKK